MIAIVETGIANTASVLRALRRVAPDPAVVVLASDPAMLGEASHLVLPGVGAFEAGMEAIGGLRDVIVEHLDADRPFLGICLGMQLLCRASEESPGVEGLGVLDARVARLPGAGRVPHLGWNRVDGIAGVFESGHAYFANSYRVSSIPDGWRASMVTHDEPFVAALSRGAALACQFHPELSGAWGASLLRQWIGGRAC
ncbi:MAG: imidazole glycerol phosphate synthase subunit HisH [Phycisphaerales bacterium]|nr:imidazole glycerol phosphate synthase subunit HisH [Phycisphaerales bacterium]